MEKKNKKVLLVDDEVKLVATVKVFLELNGYDVVTAHNGQEGLQVARAEIPDLIVSDIMMPVMDGYSMLKELKTDVKFKDIPVIMLTAKDGLSDLCEIEGARQFLVKPFDLEMLVQVVQRFLC